MEGEITLEALIAWHQQRAADCFTTSVRATLMPKSEMQALQGTAQFHIEAVRLVQTLA
jgi:hypothetical protein